MSELPQQALKPFFTDGEKIGAQYRVLDLDVSRIDEEARTVPVTFSSENGNIQRERGFEILDHSKGAIMLRRLNNGAPLLLQHDQSRQVGVVDHASVSDRKGVALLRFSRSALGQEILQDVKDGIRTQVSVGYRVFEVTPPSRDERGEVSYRATRWEPFEISLVSVPFDDSVGVGRAGDDSANAVRVITPEPAAVNKNSNTNHNTRSMSETAPPETQAPTENEATLQPAGNAETRTLAPQSTPNIIAPQKSEAEIRREETARQVAIRNMGTKFKGMEQRAEEAIEKGTSVDAFSRSITSEWNLPEEDIDTRGLNQEVGMSNKDLENFSLTSCIRSIRENGRLEGFEKEVCDQAAVNLNERNLRSREFVVPAEVFRPSQRSVEMRQMRRDMDTATATNLGYFVQDEAPRYIDKLENANILSKLGVHIIDGISGDLPFNRKTGSTTGYWLGETQSATESDLSGGQLWMRPKRLVIRSVQSDQILMQTDGLSQRLIEDDMAEQEGLAVQLAFFNGSGAGAEPLGVNKQIGIGSVTFGAAPTYAKWASFWREVRKDNADLGSTGFVGNTDALYAALTTVRESGDSKNIIEADNYNAGMFRFNGMPVLETNQAFDIADQLLYGSWKQSMWGRWQARKIMVDEYTKMQTGQFVIQQSSYHDTNVRHVESFAASTDGAAQ